MEEKQKQLNKFIQALEKLGYNEFMSTPSARIGEDKRYVYFVKQENVDIDSPNPKSIQTKHQLIELNSCRYFFKEIKLNPKDPNSIAVEIAVEVNLEKFEAIFYNYLSNTDLQIKAVTSILLKQYEAIGLDTSDMITHLESKIVQELISNHRHYTKNL